MKQEKTLMLSGKTYQEIKTQLQNKPKYLYNSGTEQNPELIQITNISLDTDPEFTRNPDEQAKINEDTEIQVITEFEIL